MGERAQRKSLWSLPSRVSVDDVFPAARTIATPARKSQRLQVAFATAGSP